MYNFDKKCSLKYNPIVCYFVFVKHVQSYLIYTRIYYCTSFKLIYWVFFIAHILNPNNISSNKKLIYATSNSALFRGLSSLNILIIISFALYCGITNTSEKRLWDCVFISLITVLYEWFETYKFKKLIYVFQMEVLNSFL